MFQNELWVLGERATEIYQDAGLPDFPFQRISGGIEHGCLAKHSLAKADGAVFWLSRDTEGQAIVMRGASYKALRISTHAIEATLQTYTRLDDATGYIYQQGGHTIYDLTFPTQNVTWCYDLATQQWHEWSTSGGRHRSACHAAWHGMNLVGDYATGDVYALDLYTYTDAGAPISRLRAFPHMTRGGHRVMYTQMIADMEAGTIPDGIAAPSLTLRYSDDRGATWSGTQTTEFGGHGDTLVSLQFQRLGMARDRVFQLSWDAPMATSLLGAWIDSHEAGS